MNIIFLCVFCGFISFPFRVCRFAEAVKKQGKELVKEANHESLVITGSQKQLEFIKIQEQDVLQ